MNIGDLYFSFRGDSKQLELDAKKSGEQAGKTIGQQMTAALKSGDWGSFLKAGLGLGAGLAVFSAAKNLLGGVVDAFGDAVGAASDLEESQAKVNQVFSESSDVIDDWAEGSARGFGLSEQAALEAVGTFGNFIQALGNTEQEANTMSRSLVELASDLASFNNMEVSDVLVSLRSGLAGEAEPMRRLGVSISATRVEAYILANGIAKTKASITDAMKVAARYAIIMDDTAMAQGDFSRTSGGLANQQRILAAEMDNAMATLGAALLPIATGLTTLAADVIPAIVGGIEDFAGAVSGIADDVNALVTGNVRLSTSAQLIADEMGVSADALIRNANALKQADEAARQAAALKDELAISEDKYAATISESMLVQQEVEAALAAQGETVHELTGEEELLYRAAEQARLEQARLAQAAGATTGALRANGTAAQKAARDTRDGVGLAGDAVEGYAARVSAAKLSIIRDFGNLPTGIRDQIKDGKSTVRRAMTELRFAMEHPFADDKYARWLEKKQRVANRKLAQAISDGNVPAANQARALVTAIQTELDKLDDKTYSVDVVVDMKTGRRVGAPGRAAGGPVQANRAYWVGERGPELVIPSKSGRVVSNDAIVNASTAGGTTVNAQVYGLPMQASTPREVVAQIRRAARMGIPSGSPQRGFQPA